MSASIKLLLFTILSIVIVAISLFFANKYVKKQKSKNILFIIVSCLTVLIHYSSIVYEAVNKLEIEIIDTYYLPVYPCNIIMWQCLLISFLLIFNERTKLLTLLSNATFIIGSVCAFVGIAFNKNFLNTPDFADFDILKGLISHVTLLFCCIYLLIGGYVKFSWLKIFNSLFFQSIVFALCGIYTNLVLSITNQESVNSMYMQSPPIESMPYINVYTVIPTILVTYLIVYLIVKSIKKHKVKA